MMVSRVRFLSRPAPRYSAVTGSAAVMARCFFYFFVGRDGPASDHGERADVDGACADGALREDFGRGPRREREVVGLLALAATRCQKFPK